MTAGFPSLTFRQDTPFSLSAGGDGKETLFPRLPLAFPSLTLAFPWMTDAREASWQDELGQGHNRRRSDYHSCDFPRCPVQGKCETECSNDDCEEMLHQACSIKWYERFNLALPEAARLCEMHLCYTCLEESGEYDSAVFEEDVDEDQVHRTLPNSHSHSHAHAHASLTLTRTLPLSQPLSATRDPKCLPGTGEGLETQGG